MIRFIKLWELHNDDGFNFCLVIASNDNPESIILYASGTSNDAILKDKFMSWWSNKF